jgi:hypothetical protein
MRLLTVYQSRKWGDNELLNMAIGYVVFAREERLLFKNLFAASGADSLDRQRLQKSIESDEVRALPEFISAMDSWAHDERQEFVFQNWVFLHGLACLLADGVLKLSDREIEETIAAASKAFYLAKGGR